MGKTMIDLILKFWEAARGLLSNQRGEVGDAGEEWTQEELDALGMDEDENAEEAGEGDAGEEDAQGEDAEEGTKGETSEEGESGETSGDQQENWVPQSRVDEITRGRRETEEKLELLKSDPDRYYQQYPDERPQQRQEPGGQLKTPDVLQYQRSQEQVPEWNRQIEGGEYNGWTFSQVYARDPDYCHQTWPRIASQFQWHQLEAQKDMNNRRQSEKEKSEVEIKNFREFATKEHGEDQAEAVLNQVLDWIDQTGFYVRDDMIQTAYAIMNQKNLIAKAKAEGAASVLEKAKHGKVASISAKTEPASAPSGWEWFEKASAKEIDAKMDRMNEKDFAKFLKEAPDSVKNRDILQHLPWS
jgi:hypothetical protein